MISWSARRDGRHGWYLELSFRILVGVAVPVAVVVVAAHAAASAAVAAAASALAAFAGGAAPMRLPIVLRRVLAMPCARLCFSPRRPSGDVRRWDAYVAGEQLFGLPHTALPDLDKTKKELDLLNRLYSLYTTVISSVNEFNEMAWHEGAVWGWALHGLLEAADRIDATLCFVDDAAEAVDVRPDLGAARAERLLALVGLRRQLERNLHLPTLVPPGTS